MTSAERVRKQLAPPLTFCDLSLFYGPTGGGIRTYHDAKIRWFASQDRHRYVLIHPAERSAVSRPSPQVTVVGVRGPRIRAGYRWPADTRFLHAAICDCAPDVLETGDPWYSGPTGIWFRHTRKLRGILASFFHADPAAAYIDPWVEAGSRLTRGLRRSLGRRGEAIFYYMQRKYDVTLAASGIAETALRRHGVARVLRVPFGVDPMFQQIGGARAHRHRPPGPVRLLYCGRLQDEKGTDLLLDTVHEILRDPGVTMTVAGTGARERDVAAISHPRFTFAGYVSDRLTVADMYLAHDVLLATGPRETFGLAILEALASGLAVVGPDAGGAGELLGQLEQPFLYTSGDRSDFVRAIRAATASDPVRSSHDGMRVAARYGSWTDAIDRQVRAYGDNWAAWRSTRPTPEESRPDPAAGFGAPAPDSPPTP
jgi:alpha-1,6-mannosyltransferase